MHLLYVFHARIGSFYVGNQDGRFHSIYEEESLGNYEHAWQSAEDLAGGHTFSIASGIDTATLGIPEDLGSWEKLNQ